MTKEAKMEKVFDILKTTFPNNKPEEVLYALAVYLKENPEAAEYLQLAINI